MSLRVRVRKGDVELEVSGTKDDISSAVGNLKELMAELSAVLGGKVENVSGTSNQIPGSSPSGDTAEVPSLGKTSSGSEAILRLLSSKWGEKPRNMGEIRLALEANGLPYPATTLSGILVHLAKSGKVKRWKTSAGYVYRQQAQESSDE